MTNYKMYLLRKKIITINLTLVLLFLLSCEEKKQSQEYVAKVGNTILTEEGLENYLSEDKNTKKFKNEFVRQWVDEELLYLEAENKEFTKSKKYLSLIDAAKKQIAGSLLLEKYFEENFSKPSDNTLSLFYDKIKESLTLTDDGYVLNMFDFNNEQSASEFRNLAVQNDWNNAKYDFENDSSVVSSSSNEFLYGYRLSPLDLSRTVKALNPGEISLVVQKEPSLFTVVQLIKIIDKNTVPDFNLVKDEVEEIYYFEKRKELFQKYLDQLYSKYKVELKKVDE